MASKSTPIGAARRRARTARSADTSYTAAPIQGNSEQRVWSCAVPAVEWPEWTDLVAFTTTAARRKGGAR